MSDDMKSKPQYQAPVVMPLGELAKGKGQGWCQRGSSASNCNIGNMASPNCRTGSSARSCWGGSNPR